VDRVIVGGPAWRQLGTASWIEYSRLADLGAGLFVYPIEGIGATLLILAAAVSNYLDGNNRRAVAIPLYCAVALSAAGLLLTLKAAPIMLSLARAQPDVAIQHAFDEFFLWGLYFRGTAEFPRHGRHVGVCRSGMGAGKPPAADRLAEPSGVRASQRKD